MSHAAGQTLKPACLIASEGRPIGAASKMAFPFGMVRIFKVHIVAALGDSSRFHQPTFNFQFDHFLDLALLGLYSYFILFTFAATTNHLAERGN